MNRRSFLRSLGIGAATVVLGTKLALAKEQIIEQKYAELFTPTADLKLMLPTFNYSRLGEMIVSVQPMQVPAARIFYKDFERSWWAKLKSRLSPKKRGRTWGL